MLSLPRAFHGSSDKAESRGKSYALARLRLLLAFAFVRAGAVDATRGVLLRKAIARAFTGAGFVTRVFADGGCNS